MMITKIPPTVNSKINMATNGKPFLEPLRDISSLIYNRLKTAEATCASKLIRLTGQNFNEMIPLGAILPTMS